MAVSDLRVNCGLLNVQSARNKTLEIRDTINEEKLDLYAITETWITDYDTTITQEMTPVTHSFVHNPRRSGRGGGVGLFVSNAIKKIKKCKTRNYDTFELLQVECEINGNKMMIITIYRPPSTSSSVFIDEFRLYLETIDMVSANIIIWGDFNLWLDDIEARYVPHFIDTIATFNLVNIVDRPTSVSGHIIDLVLVDVSRDLVRDLYVAEVCSLSPVHKFVSFKLALRHMRKQIKSISYRSKRGLDCNALILSICDKIMNRSKDSCNHQSTTKSECLECLYSLYNTIARDDYETMCPMVSKKILVKDDSPWFNDEILAAKRDKRKKERKWRRQQTDQRKRDYNRARNYEKRLITARKRNFYRDKTTQAGANISKLYKVLDNLTGSKRKHNLPEGYSDSELASCFLDFFDNKIGRITATFTNTQAEIINNIQVPVEKLSSFREVNESEVKNVIKRAKYTHCANDPVPVGVIAGSENFDRLVTVTTRMVNLSISSGVFPDSEKKAIVKPILKGNLNPQCLSSFRPVSNLTFQSKVLESVILQQLNNHLDMVEAIPDGQSAYRCLYSTETALCTMVSDMRGLLDEGKCGLLLLLDLSAAFDTVVHSILLRVCENIGIEGAALAYLRSYLEGRAYCVQIGEEFSDSRPLTSGVPQGSVLGPVLFSVYTADLSTVLERHGVKFKLFADDTQFCLSLANVQEVEDRLSAVMLDIRQWMNSRQLKLNEDKTECLFVGRELDRDRMNVQSLSVNNTDITVGDQVKNLGVLLDTELLMKDQISHVVKVAGYHLRNISFIKKYLDENSIKKLISNHVISKLDYTNSVYYGLPNYLLKKLQLIMNRAARLIKGRSLRDRVTPILIELHWLPVKARIVYKQCVMVRQAIRHGKPKYVRDMLTDFRTDSDIILRHDDDGYRLMEPRFYKEAGRRAFVNCAPRLYNAIPANIKMAETVDVFKKRLKTYLFTEAYDLESEVIREEYRC